MPEQQQLTPMDIADKWIATAARLWSGGTRTFHDANVATLHNRVLAHFGTASTHISYQDVCAVACVEAMNEWQHIQEELHQSSAGT